MKLFKRKDEFYIKNLTEVNILVERILFATIFVPVVFMILNTLGIFLIPKKFLLELFLMSVIMTLASIVFNRVKNSNVSRLNVYFEMLCVSLFIGFLASGQDNFIEVYISYAFIPLISCLYYSVKTTNICSAFGYLLMLLSLFVRSSREYYFSIFTGNLLSGKEWWLTNFIGLSIEYCIVYIISLYISYRLKSYYDKLIVAQKEKEQVYGELVDKSKKVFEANDRLVRNSYQMYDIQDKLIQFIGEVIGSHDLFTGNHIIHTRVYVGLIARDLRKRDLYEDELSDDKIRLYEMAALLHDIGKIHVPENILNSTSKFTPKEFEIMKSHTSEGKKLLGFLPQIEGGVFNKIAVDMAYYHHERWDGTGYPTNKIGTETPFCARLMAAADVLDALISQRLYKNSMSVDDALKIFEDGKGTQFETCIAESVINCRNQIIEIDQKFKITEFEKNTDERDWWVNYHKKLKVLGIK